MKAVREKALSYFLKLLQQRKVICLMQNWQEKRPQRKMAQVLSSCLWIRALTLWSCDGKTIQRMSMKQRYFGKSRYRVYIWRTVTDIFWLHYWQYVQLPFWCWEDISQWKNMAKYFFWLVWDWQRAFPYFQIICVWAMIFCIILPGWRAFIRDCSAENFRWESTRYSPAAMAICRQRCILLCFCFRWHCCDLPACQSCCAIKYYWLAWILLRHSSASMQSVTSHVQKSLPGLWVSYIPLQPTGWPICIIEQPWERAWLWYSYRYCCGEPMKFFTEKKENGIYWYWEFPEYWSHMFFLLKCVFYSLWQRGFCGWSVVLSAIGRH